MIKPKVIILSGYGLNCEEETALAFELAGAKVEIVHLNDLIAKKKKLSSYQIMAVPGGFAYGDDTGSGKAYANKMRNHLSADIKKFVESEKLVIGICNGFQVISQLGLVPGALTFNSGGRYIDRWVDLKVVGKSPWLVGIKTLSVPIAHGEGNYYADKKALAELKENKAIGLEYTAGEICKYQNLSANPNGSLQNIAGVTAYNGRILGLMPHPERGMFFEQLPNAPLLREKYRRTGRKPEKFTGSLQLFKNAVNYFKK
jgi:phosphoribosylformylglycinamidine synthase